MVDRIIKSGDVEGGYEIARGAKPALSIKSHGVQKTAAQLRLLRHGEREKKEDLSRNSR